jgi:hypothetical protein
MSVVGRGPAQASNSASHGSVDPDEISAINPCNHEAIQQFEALMAFVPWDKPSTNLSQ